MMHDTGQPAILKKHHNKRHCTKDQLEITKSVLSLFLPLSLCSHSLGRVIWVDRLRKVIVDQPVNNSLIVISLSLHSAGDLVLFP